MNVVRNTVEIQIGKFSDRIEFKTLEENMKIYMMYGNWSKVAEFTYQELLEFLKKRIHK